MKKETVKNRPIVLANELDEYAIRLNCAIQLLVPISECVRNGENAAECYDDSLMGAYFYLVALHDELRGMIDKAFRDFRRGKDER